jgi:Cu/Ag efflux protein CusF
VKASSTKQVAAFALAVALAAPAWAQHYSNHALADGEVRKVDKEAKKITLKHGPLANLDMPAMTMVFQVADPAMLEQVKAGDKVSFQAENIDGRYTITRIARKN